MQLIDKNFKEEHKLNKIINRNNCKISYSCIRNIKKLIQKLNCIYLKQKTMKKTKHFATVEQKINVLSITNAQLIMLYIK